MKVLTGKAADSDPDPKCPVGCQHYYGGEIRHLPECPYYPGSRTKMYDDALARIKELELELQNKLNHT